MSNLSKRQKEMGLVILAVLFLLVLAAYSYFQIYAPAKDANERALQMLTNERDILFALQRQEAQQQPSGSSSSRPLQEKLPVKPLEDLILLQVQKAEVKSDTYVHEVNFSLEDVVIENPPEHVENVQTVLTEVHLEAAEYSQVDQFIEEIESMERIYMVERIEFDAPEEVKTMEQENEMLELVITFQAFYRLDLGNLVEEAPKVDAPAPAGKRDPTPINQMPGLGDSE
ncbi:pilus assembly protein PilO [Sporosarcina sp. ACRSL]|uniref:pilus assembly protein PilO n=1 Tax=Sporosarcina sp. ACRSL TaxID=2918215 RepID=UPI001EF5F15F|nr:pilus assembly protein PilO [Sporosarcina sp. ACRSL]MCG7345008.1 pilus assembly protein PilO [Sporosarcina sp. ACRSL]